MLTSMRATSGSSAWGASQGRMGRMCGRSLHVVTGGKLRGFQSLNSHLRFAHFVQDDGNVLPRETDRVSRRGQQTGTAASPEKQNNGKGENLTSRRLTPPGRALGVDRSSK